MIIDKNGKLFGKINIIDFAVVLLIIVAVFGIGLRFFSKAAKEIKETVKFSYTAEIEGVRIFSVDALKKSKEVLNQGNVVGEITGVKYEAYKSPEIDENGNLRLVEVPEKYKVIVDVTVDGNITDNGYFVGENTEISVGSNVLIDTKYINAYAKVTDIRVEE